MLGLIIVLLSWIDSSRGEKVQINAQAPMVLVTASYGCYISKGGVYLETHLSVCFIYTPKVQSRIVPYDNAMQCGPYLSAIFPFNQKASTYDHRVWKTGLPVRSAVLKPHAGRLVVGWVTTSESRLLYVFVFFFCERSEHL